MQICPFRQSVRVHESNHHRHHQHHHYQTPPPPLISPFHTTETKRGALCPATHAHTHTRFRVHKAAPPSTVHRAVQSTNKPHTESQQQTHTPCGPRARARTPPATLAQTTKEEVCVHATEAQKFTFNETYNRIQEKKSKQRVCRAVHAHARMRARACRQLPALTSHFDRAARERENSRTYARTNACRHTHLMPTCLYIYVLCAEDD